jgi:hypothetical protein
MERINAALAAALGQKAEDPMHIEVGKIPDVPSKDTMTMQDLAGARAGFHTAWIEGIPAVIYKGETNNLSIFTLIEVLPAEG